MTFSRLLVLPVLAACLLVLPQAASAKERAAAKAQPETTLEVKAKLDAFARAHVNRANATLVPGKTSMLIKKDKGQYVAQYLEVDTDTLTTEIYPATSVGCQYVGHIVYLEKVYECSGNSKLEAQNGTFKAIKARKIRELTRYDKGAWQY